jgi:hypothetical protein
MENSPIKCTGNILVSKFFATCQSAQMTYSFSLLRRNCKTFSLFSVANKKFLWWLVIDRHSPTTSCYLYSITWSFRHKIKVFSVLVAKKRAGRQEFHSRNGNFSFSLPLPNGLWAYSPTFQWVPGIRRSGFEVHNLPPYSGEDKNVWSYTSTPPIRLHGVVLS